MRDDAVNSVEDAIRIASQLGRLDFASTLLACVAILLAVAAIPAYLLVQRKAAQVARDEVEKIRNEAHRIAESAAVQKMEQLLPAIVAEYMELGANYVDAATADEIAGAQDYGAENDP